MILWIIYIALDAIINWYWIEKKKSVPNYAMLTVIRGWFFVVIGITQNISPETLWPWFFFCTCSFWVLFDISINLLRRKSVFYLGENAKIDRFGRKFPYLYWSLKFVALIVAIYLSLVYG